MTRSPEEPKSFVEAFVYGAVQLVTWALPVVASSLLVVWLHKTIDKGDIGTRGLPPQRF
jgi:hypothetical protein